MKMKIKSFLLGTSIVTLPIIGSIVCGVVFKITGSNEDELLQGIHLEFSVKTRSRVPSYIRKGKLREDVVYTSTVQYYHTSLAQEESGEVMVNFKIS